MQRTSSNASRSSDREPDADEDRLGKPQRLAQDEDDGDREIGVAHRVNPLPLREEEEEELSEADILEELDMDELEADGGARTQRKDA
jgi:hypothetical protein